MPPPALGLLENIFCDCPDILKLSGRMITIDTSKPPNQWTSVVIGLPDDEQAVLIALADGDVWTGYMDAGEWRYISGDLMQSKVTHWMDMPEPPL